jgi:hypothetical protein
MTKLVIRLQDNNRFIQNESCTLLCHMDFEQLEGKQIYFFIFKLILAN